MENLKKPLLPPLVLALSATLGFAIAPAAFRSAAHPGAPVAGRSSERAASSTSAHPSTHSHSSTRPPRHRSSASHHVHRTHRAHRPSAVTIPHPPRHVTYEERKTLFDRAGIPRSRWHDYVVDHRVPLELGGTNTLSNLQIQDRVIAKRKDRVENYLAARVRRGQLSLGEAQALMQRWETVRVPG